MPFTGYWQGKPFGCRSHFFSGNVQTNWAMFHNITASCWYRLVPA